MDNLRGASQEVECLGVLATAAEWREVRATLADVAARAAFVGYASERVGPWELSAQRRSMGQWPPGDAQLLVTVQHRHDLVRQWLAELPVQGALS
jgi:hypothetical protein